MKMMFTRRALMKAMEQVLGLKVGDRIKLSDESIYEVVEHLNGNPFLRKLNTNIPIVQPLAFLVDKEIEILPQPKRIGDLKCTHYIHDCFRCPIRSICSGSVGELNNESTLYQHLEAYKDIKISFDQEIYDLLKARLDKEAE